MNHFFWMIEKIGAPLCLGIDLGVWCDVAFTDKRALKFITKEDAEMFIAKLRKGHPYKVEEHGFVEPS